MSKKILYLLIKINVFKFYVFVFVNLIIFYLHPLQKKIKMFFIYSSALDTSAVTWNSPAPGN